jgi:hypothetical protein
MHGFRERVRPLEPLLRRAIASGCGHDDDRVDGVLVVGLGCHAVGAVGVRAEQRTLRGSHRCVVGGGGQIETDPFGAGQRADRCARGTADRLVVVRRRVLPAVRGVTEAHCDDHRSRRRPQCGHLGDLVLLACAAECCDRRGQLALERLVDVFGPRRQDNSVRTFRDADDQCVDLQAGGFGIAQSDCGHR